MNSIPDTLNFQRLKVAKKEHLTKTIFTLEFEIPEEMSEHYRFSAGQYVTVKFTHQGKVVSRDYSLTSAPHENKLTLAVRFKNEESASSSLEKFVQEGSFLDVSYPRGRFTLNEKPHEFRTIVAFAAGIGITPIISHLKNILRTEPRTRFFLFYGNKNFSDVAFKKELDLLLAENPERLQIYYFYSGEQLSNPFLKGRLDEKKLELIINQYLHLDDTDEESTIWDAVDEVLICGNGDMIKSLANACYRHGIPKKNIHFELFEAYNDGIYPVEKKFPLIENIEVTFRRNNRNYTTILKDNREKLLPQLLEMGYNVPYSCKSGLCGSCECVLEEGEVDLLENEYLTESEVLKDHILPCMSIVLSRRLKINFDTI